MRFALAVIGMGSFGCNLKDNVVRIPQAGVVPRARLDLYDGQPLAGKYRVEGYAQTTPIAPSPREFPTGSAVARHQLGAAGRLRLGERTDVGAMVDIAPGGGAIRDDVDSTVDPPGSFAAGVGVSLRTSVPLGEALHVGIGGGLKVWSVPLRSRDEGDSRESATTFQLFIVPGYRTGRVVVFAGAGVVNNTKVLSAYERDKKRINGDPVGVVFAGGRYDLSPSTWLALRVGTARGDQSEVPLVDLTVGFDLQPASE